MHIEVETKGGSLAVTVKDESGAELFARQGLETASFDVQAQGPVTVSFTAKGHSGGFSVRYA